jgi:hypothetical protein
VLNTMIAVGNAMGIAIIGSPFFGMIGVGPTSATSHIGNSNNHVKTHHYTDALVNSIVYTIGLVLATFFLIFLLPSISTKER